MLLLPADHPERIVLADEVHARPPEALETPSRATYLALMLDAEQRAAEHAHLAALCERYGVAPPDPSVTQFSTALGAVRLKWERHGEFSSLTLIAPNLSPQPFTEPVAALLPEGWLRDMPGRVITAAHAKIISVGSVADTLTSSGAVPDGAFLARHFGPHIVVGAEVGGGAGWVFTDFRIHADGCARFLLIDRGFTPRQAGRMMQRLFEIEAYRMLSLLALPIARRLAPRTVAIERALAQLTEGIAIGEGADETLLHELTRLAAEVESGLAASQFRFGACRAYAELVRTRISELRETRIPGLQTIEEFMARRFTPAVNTCATVSQRLHDLSERVAQASALLATRVGIARERQNQALLASMDRRARLQLRLQQTVEGLSVAAIVYYSAGLVGYLAKGANSGGVPLNTDLVVAVAVPVLAVAALLAVRRARRHIQDAERAEAERRGPALDH
jgi:uncharacterized membrane-anchored protein